MLAFHITIIIVLLLCSACFSGFETALFSIPRLRLQSYLREKRRSAGTLGHLLTRPRRILVTLLTGNLLVNVGASSVLTLIVIDLTHTYHLNKTVALVIEFFIMSYVLLVVGEITPKAIALKRYEPIAFNLAPVMNVLNYLFTPVSHTLDWLFEKLLPKTEAKKVSARDLTIMLQDAKTANIIEEDELGIARQLLGLSKRTVAQAMTPATEVVTIPDSATVGKARGKIHRSRHSRLIVIEGSSKNVTGVLYGKDIVFFEDHEPIRGHLREAYFVPETKNLESLLNEFRRRVMHIAVVTDEFGEFAGIITLEDILESLVGEIVDEYDETEDIPFQRLDADHYLFDGNVTIQNVLDAFNLAQVDESGERLSAFLLRSFGHIPKEGESMVYLGLIFTVKEVTRRKIKNVTVSRQ